MSTCNFNNQCNFDLWVIDTDNENDDFFFDDLQLNFNYIVKSLPDLKFHNLILKGGYYSGVQIFIETIRNPYELDYYECKYYFDTCKSKCTVQYDREVNKINKKLLSKFKDIGFFKINCVGVFSNGEAIYERAQK